MKPSRKSKAISSKDSAARQLSLDNEDESNGDANSVADTQSEGVVMEYGLADSQYCNTCEKTATAVSRIISSRLAMTNESETKLTAAMSEYFTACGIDSDTALASMDGARWPKPSESVKTPHVTRLTCPVMNVLEQAVSLTMGVQETNMFLTEHSTYSDLQNLVSNDSSRTHASEADHSTLKGSNGIRQEGKIPSFKLPIYDGDLTEGVAYVDAIVETFSSNGVEQFLDDVPYCQSRLSWSSAFASRLKKSLKDAKVLSFIAQKHKVEKNSAIVWQAVVLHLSGNNVKICHQMTIWRQFLSLKCETMADFPLFYSNVFTFVDMLERDKSIAVRDDTFLKCYLSQKVNVTELEQTTRKFVMEGSPPYDKILEAIRKDYDAQKGN